MFQVQGIVTNVHGASVTGFLTPEPIPDLDDAKAARDEAQHNMADGKSIILFNKPPTFMNGFRTMSMTETLIMPDVAAESIFTFNVMEDA